MSLHTAEDKAPHEEQQEEITMGGRSSNSGIRSTAERIQTAMNNSVRARTFFEENATLPQDQLATMMETLARSERDVARRVTAAQFTEEGNGNWQLDIPDIGGGQILDETGGTRAYREGFMPNQRVYSATAWVYDENGNPQMIDLGTFTNHRDARVAVKNAIRGNSR